MRFCGRGGAGGTIDIRFIRLASVGLMVRAPRPDAWFGMTDIRLLVPGVVVRPGAPLRRFGVVGSTYDEVGRLVSGLESVNKSLEL